MVLVIDIGNTNIVGALYKDGIAFETWRLHTVSKKTEDEYGTMFRSILAERGINPHAIEKTILSSVVPALSASIQKMVLHLTGKEALVLGSQSYAKLPIKLANPYEIGADLVANALAAYTRTKGASIIVDFGTALTFTCVSEEGELIGVDIVPGLQTAVQALSRDTAQLPYVQLTLPPSAIGTNTVTAIQAGIVHGYVGLVEHLVAKIKEEMKGRVTVIATGGLHRIIAPLTNVFDIVDPDLTLNGLYECSHFI